MANSYLTRTPSSTGNNQVFTISCWLRRSNLGAQQIFANAYNAQSDNGFLSARFSSTDQLELTGWSTTWRVSSKKYRDCSAWYHIVIAIDSTQGTAGDRIKIYENGSQITDFATSNDPSVNHNFPFNTASFVQDIGANNYGSGRVQFYDGYISHYAQVDGQQLAPTVFGSTDSTSGIWKFKTPTGVSWGTNGVHLKFENSGALGTDSSGQSNTYTVGGNLKQSKNTPTLLWATTLPTATNNWKQSSNPNLASNAATSLLENGGQHKQSPSSMAASTGKWYCEVKITSGSDAVYGVVSSTLMSFSGDNYLYAGMNRTGSGIGLNISNGNKIVAGSESTHGAQISNGDILMMALDVTNQKFYFGKNGAWANGSGAYSGSFDASVAAISLPTNGDYNSSFQPFYHFSFSPYNASCDINFGQGTFGTSAVASAGSSSSGDDSVWEYDCPTGYYGLNSKNLNTYG